ncbi:hypothetical protein KUF83_30455 [Streptomyces sp. BV286]|uniref:hypothetical protein n=1 Tax=Streptomyces sp. BV286 TaxID=2849672 RepID=UPI001C2EEE59|nr:hypothetical protein [Streptomyces sp. BV286]MBV1940859.1 hypothetical protein [Streptomyces sp. BV286]
MGYEDELQNFVNKIDDAMRPLALMREQAWGEVFRRTAHRLDSDDAEAGLVGEEEFVPLSDEELEARLSSLGSLVVSALPDDIESISDSSRFFRQLKTEESENGLWNSVAAEFSEEEKAAIEISRAAEAMDWLLRGSPSSGFESDRRAFSSVFVVCEGRMYANPYRTPQRELRQSQDEPVLRDSELADAMIEWGACPDPGNRERLRDRITWLSAAARGRAMYLQQLRGAVQAYTLRADVRVWDVTGARERPGEALTALVSEATDFGAAIRGDGQWSLLVTAPAAAEEHGSAAAGPRVAVMELPSPPPGPMPADGKLRDFDGQLLDLITNALEVM